MAFGTLRITYTNGFLRFSPVGLYGAKYQAATTQSNRDY
jgi:hypothetical protein